MQRFCIAAVAASLALASSARAYLITGNTFHIQNKANQSITLAVTGEGGDAQVAGVVLRGQLGDGNGPNAEPAFVSFDFTTNTIFSAANASDPAHSTTDFSGQNGTGVGGTQSSDIGSAGVSFHSAGVTTASVTGNLVTIVLDASNITSANVTNGGNYVLDLITSADAGGSSKFTLNGGSTVSAHSGAITVNVSVPEPTGALSIGAITGLLALRRRRAARRPC